MCRLRVATRSLFSSFVLFVVACSAPSPATPPSESGQEPGAVSPAPLRNADAVIDAVAARLRALPVAASSGAPGTALPAEVVSDRQLSATIVGHWGAAQTRDRSWIVQVPWDGSARVLAIASSHGAVSSALNIPGDQNVDLHGHNVVLPLAVWPGDSLVLLSGSEGGNAAAPLGFASANGAVDEAMAIVFVPYEVSSAWYRPPAIGRRDNPIIAFLRTYSPIPEALAQMSNLPGVIDLDEIYQIPGSPRPGDANRIDPSAWGAARPTIENSLAIHQRFCGDLYSDWRCAGRTPWTQHQGYGTFFAGSVSTAMLLMCSTAPLAERAPLAHAFVQRGLDDLGAAADGKFLYPLGGHCWGRKAQVVVCGHLLGIDVFADPTPCLGPRFAEDAYKASTWWFDPASTTWTATWPFSLAPSYDGLQVQNPPSTWGDPHAPNHDTFGWAFAYYSQVVPASLGSTLACVLMGRGDFLNRHMVQVMRQHMQGPPAAAQATMAALGISDPNWGGDYAVPAGFAAAAWRLYGTAND
jgi:hypothetical protein